MGGDPYLLKRVQHIGLGLTRLRLWGLGLKVQDMIGFRVQSLRPFENLVSGAFRPAAACHRAGINFTSGSGERITYSPP